MLVTYVFNQFTVKGAECIRLGTTKIPFGFRPLVLNNGVVVCLVWGGFFFSFGISKAEA
jgi:WD repeat-containing protein 19